MDHKIDYIGKCLLINDKEAKILVVGDLHIGFEESLNESGVFLSRQMYEGMIKYFDNVFARIGKADKIILLGDVKHEFGRILRQEWKEVLGLIDYFKEKISKVGEIIIIKGNHDKIIEPVARKKGVIVKDFYIFKGFAFLHGDRDFLECYDKKIRYWIIGHGHPAIKLKEGVKVEAYKCYLVGKHKGKGVIIVPSFFEYNEGSDPRESELGLAWDFELMNFDVKIVGENLEVLEFKKLKKMRN